jgi:hypothetical protein
LLQKKLYLYLQEILSVTKHFILKVEKRMKNLEVAIIWTVFCGESVLNCKNCKFGMGFYDRTDRGCRRGSLFLRAENFKDQETLKVWYA